MEKQQPSPLWEDENDIEPKKNYMVDVFNNAFKDFEPTPIGFPYIAMIFYSLNSFNVAKACKYLHKKGMYQYFLFNTSIFKQELYSFLH